MEQNDLPGGEQNDDIKGRYEPTPLDARQRRVFEALNDVHPELGKVYLGSVRALTDPLNPAGAYHAAHSLRDICNMLHEYLRITYEGPRTGKHRATKAMILGLDSDDPVVKHFHHVCEKLKTYAHLRSPGKAPPRREDVSRDLRELEEVILALLRDFYEVFPELDELLSVDVPTEEDVQKLLALLARPGKARRDYFFNKLETPGWLGPLCEAGFFANPPEPIRNEEQDTTGFPVWPESRYLARMAKHEPQTVRDIILGILAQPGDIENPRVVEDFVEAALAMPADLAADIARHAKKWRRPYFSLLPEKLAQLMKKLAEGGQHRLALDLGRWLLGLRPDDEAIQRAQEQGVSLAVEPEAKPYMDVHDYERILKEHFPTVADAVRIDALKLICDLLEESLSIEDIPAGGPDYSCIWRPAVEDHPQNLGYQLKENLVEAVRDTARQLIETQPDEAKQVLDELESRSFPIFQRIALYLLSARPEADEERAVERLCDRDVLEDGNMRHEYYLLAQAWFPHLEPPEQQQILGWIEAGPEEEEAATKWDGTRHSQEEIDKYRQWWKRDKLALFEGALPAEWESKYKALVAELGEPEHPEFVSYHEARMGIPSPKLAEELNEMTTAGLVQFLADWQAPKDEVWGPAPEGLGQELQRAVESTPDRYAQDAEQFKGLPPTYVRNVFGGLITVCRAGDNYPWEPVLELCKWAIEQPEPQQTEAASSRGEADPGWEWTRKAIADLVSEGLQRDQIPFEFRETVWGILEPLSNDANPTPEHEERYGGTNMAPMTLAINTVRGEAIHAVVQYALWCARHLRPDDPALAQGPPVWREIPEVEEVLDHHLEPANDPSAAIRSVYGERLPWLVLLSREWVRTNLDRIFPKGPEYQYLWEAAWGSYVIFNRPYGDVVDIIKGAYRTAVDKLGEQGVGAWRGPGPKKRLAQHLMLLYWRGRLSLEDSLLGRFFLKGSPEVRAAALAFIGRSLQQMDEAIPLNDPRRLCDLLESRIAAAQQDEDQDGVQEELSNFGWWFASGQLSNKWALQRLLDVLNLTDGVIQFDSAVAERLALLAFEHPSIAVACLAKMVEGDREGWHILGWQKHARKTLSTALSSSDEEAQSSARDIIDGLGERGNHEFRDLLGR